MYDTEKKKEVRHLPQVRPVGLDSQPEAQPPDPFQLQRQAVYRHTTRPVRAQRQLAQPVLRAAALYRDEVERLSVQRQVLAQEASELKVPALIVEAALQRQEAAAPSFPVKPQSVGDWVTVMRLQAEQAQGRRMGAKEEAQFTALQRQVTQTLTRSYLADRQTATQRQQEYAGHVTALQRHPVSAQVARAFLFSVPQGERPALQRAVEEAGLREAIQQEQEQRALRFLGLQRQMAELDAQATQPVYERIQQRRGVGNPLPGAVQRHLEHGLNHDLSAVRVHDDAEADKLSKAVNALAFTSGTDIYFQSGKFNPNSQSGLELLAHEVTHAVQQSKGHVGKGIDPDAGLESEARDMGRKLASAPLTPSRARGLPHFRRQKVARGVLQRSTGTPNATTAKVPEWQGIPLTYAIQQQVVASRAFKLLRPDEQKMVLRYLGSNDPYVSGPARREVNYELAIKQIDLTDPKDLRDLLRIQPSRDAVLAPVAGTFDKARNPYVVSAPTYIKGHQYEGQTANARVYTVTIKGKQVKVYIPVVEDPKKGNFHTIDEIAKGLAALPEASLKLLNSVDVEPSANPADAYWAKQYKIQNFRSYMTAGADGVVNVYPSRAKVSQTYLDGSLIHETGHVFSERNFTAQMWKDWQTAAQKDKIFVSSYAANAPREDFSETLELYYMIKGNPSLQQMKPIFQNRINLIEQYMKLSNSGQPKDSKSQDTLFMKAKESAKQIIENVKQFLNSMPTVATARPTAPAGFNGSIQSSPLIRSAAGVQVQKKGEGRLSIRGKTEKASRI